MFFRQLFDPETSTYSYLLADSESRDAVLIDPVREQAARDTQLLKELGLRLRFVLETHVHADHVTGAGLLCEAFGCKAVVSERSGVLTADRRVRTGDVINFGSHTLEVRETPGHTEGCVTYVCHRSEMAFTGDALLIRGCGRTDFQAGDARALYRSVHDHIFSLPPETLLYPGHDYQGRTVTTVMEEMEFNPRLAVSRSLEEFVTTMDRLELAYPRRIDEAVPANMASGVTEPEPIHASSDPRDAWAPVMRTSSGVPVILGDWLSTQREQVRIIDVREHLEFCGPLGHIDGAELVPLSKLDEATRSWKTREPIVLVCAHGTRSGNAAVALAKRGFPQVASLHGGMTLWSAEGHAAVEILGDRGRQDAEAFVGMGI
jgi:glyoxylase-like metal-dependent hydrolase (beta-lactamase superfamily II)/rhodanese-related sulfurtransferase